MKYVFINLFYALKENVPDEEIRILIYEDIIPTLFFQDKKLLLELTLEDSSFYQAYEKFNEKSK